MTKKDGSVSADTCRVAALGQAQGEGAGGRGQALLPGSSQFRKGDVQASRSSPRSDSRLWHPEGYRVARGRTLWNPRCMAGDGGGGGVWGHSVEKVVCWCLRDDQGFARDGREKPLREMGDV